MAWALVVMHVTFQESGDRWQTTGDKWNVTFMIFFSFSIFCLFLFAHVPFCMFLVRFCMFFTVSVCFCLFLSISIHFSQFLSFLSISVSFFPSQGFCWCWCYHLHTLRDLVSPVCNIFFFEVICSHTYLELTQLLTKFVGIYSAVISLQGLSSTWNV